MKSLSVRFQWEEKVALSLGRTFVQVTQIWRGPRKKPCCLAAFTPLRVSASNSSIAIPSWCRIEASPAFQCALNTSVSLGIFQVFISKLGLLRHATFRTQLPPGSQPHQLLLNYPAPVVWVNPVGILHAPPTHTLYILLVLFFWRVLLTTCVKPWFLCMYFGFQANLQNV